MKKIIISLLTLSACAEPSCPCDHLGARIDSMEQKVDTLEDRLETLSGWAVIFSE